MAEIRRGLPGEGGAERLPWLEPVEDEDAYEEPVNRGFGRVMLILIAAIVLIVGAIIAFGRWHARHADVGEVIHAPPGPYKEKPKDPGGLKVDGSGVVAERTGTGSDLDAPLDLAALPEQPVMGPGSGAPAPAPSAAQKAAAPTPAAKVPAPVVAAPKPVVAEPAPKVVKPEPEPAAPAGGGGTIQLGALNSEAKAKAVWKSLSSRFAFLSPLTMSITPVKVGDDTLYRLRASGGDARNLCARLKVAGESCNVVG